MLLSPKQVIFIAITRYLTPDQTDAFKTECKSFLRLPASKFIKISAKYFNFESLKTKPVQPEDIWIYNYLMYDTQRPENSKIFDLGNKIEFTGKLPRTLLIRNYEKKIIRPHFERYREAGLILNVLF